MRLALGTVQFGLKYGVANTGGQVAAREVARILQCARDLKVDTLDTAIAYGTSEEVLGELGISDFRIVTKLPPLEGANLSEAQADPVGFVERAVTGSLTRLGVQRLEAVLFHRTSDASGNLGPSLWKALAKLQVTGAIGALGLSIYSPEELEGCREDAPLGLVQAPINALDTRLEDSGWTKRLTDRGAKIHSRSAFLQGLLIMPPEERPAKFNRWANVWQAWDDWRMRNDLTPLQAAVFCALSAPGIARIIVGVDTKTQLIAISQAIDDVSHRADLKRPVFQGQDTDLLIPMRWNSL